MSKCDSAGRPREQNRVFHHLRSLRHVLQHQSVCFVSSVGFRKRGHDCIYVCVCAYLCVSVRSAARGWGVQSGSPSTPTRPQTLTHARVHPGKFGRKGPRGERRRGRRRRGRRRRRERGEGFGRRKRERGLFSGSPDGAFRMGWGLSLFLYLSLHLSLYLCLYVFLFLSLSLHFSLSLFLLSISLSLSHRIGVCSNLSFHLSLFVFVSMFLSFYFSTFFF